MDDVDAVQASIAHTMMESGDYVTARLDGVAYMEKAPLKYWVIALFFRIFGVHDWAARLVIALSAIGLCLVTARFAAWAMGGLAGLYSGLVLATSVGTFLFTRVLLPDPLLALWIALALYCFARAAEPDEPRPRRYARSMWVFAALALLTKGLIGLLFPAAAAVLFLLFSGRIRNGALWRTLCPWEGILLFVAIAAPWHIAAILANPPYFDFTLHSERGSYHGFFWFYFINEHVLRFLNLRYPRDYNTVPRPLFWLLHLVWFFPWSVYAWRMRKLSFRQDSRAGRVRLLALCWCGFVMVFFTFSTTQEYYSFSCYAGFALLLGSAMAIDSDRLEIAARVSGSIALVAAAALAFILWSVRNLPAPGDIAQALTQHVEDYSLSMGHMLDLTMGAFAYLRLPLAVALVAALLGGLGTWLLKGSRAVISLAVMMVVFFIAVRLALAVFDPYMGSEPLAEALRNSPPGRLIIDDEYYNFSSVMFYADTRALIWNGRENNLVYGSYAPGAPAVFIDDTQFLQRWNSPDRWYVLATAERAESLKSLTGSSKPIQIAEAGNKYLFSNR